MENSNRKLWYVLAVFIIAGFTAAGYYFSSSQDTVAQPPSLKIGSVLLKGQSVKGHLVTYDDADKSKFAKLKVEAEKSSLSGVAMNKGVGFYYSEKDIALADILDPSKCMNPDVGRTLFFYYSPGAELNMKKSGFYIWPTLLGSAENPGIVDASKFVISKGRVFGLYTDKEAKSYCFKGANEKSAVSPDLASIKNGWVQIAANDDKLVTIIASVKNCVNSVFVQDGDSNFNNKIVKDKYGSHSLGNYKLLWLELKDCGVVSEGQKVSDKPDLATNVAVLPGSNSGISKFGWSIPASTGGKKISGYKLYINDAPVEIAKDKNFYNSELVGGNPYKVAVCVLYDGDDNEYCGKNLNYTPVVAVSDAVITTDQKSAVNVVVDDTKVLLDHSYKVATDSTSVDVKWTSGDGSPSTTYKLNLPIGYTVVEDKQVLKDKPDNNLLVGKNGDGVVVIYFDFTWDRGFSATPAAAYKDFVSAELKDGAIIITELFGFYNVIEGESLNLGALIDAVADTGKVIEIEDVLGNNPFNFDRTESQNKKTGAYTSTWTISLNQFVKGKLAELGDNVFPLNLKVEGGGSGGTLYPIGGSDNGLYSLVLTKNGLTVTNGKSRVKQGKDAFSITVWDTVDWPGWGNYIGKNNKFDYKLSLFPPSAPDKVLSKHSSLSVTVFLPNLVIEKISQETLCTDLKYTNIGDGFIPSNAWDKIYVTTYNKSGATNRGGTKLCSLMDKGYMQCGKTIEAGSSETDGDCGNTYNTVDATLWQSNPDLWIYNYKAKAPLYTLPQ